MILKREGKKLLVELPAIDHRMEFYQTSLEPVKFATITQSRALKRGTLFLGTPDEAFLSELIVAELLGDYESLLISIDEFTEKFNDVMLVFGITSSSEPIIIIRNKKRSKVEALVSYKGIQKISSVDIIPEYKKIDNYRTLLINYKDRYLMIKTEHGAFHNLMRLSVMSLSEPIDYLEVNWSDLAIDKIKPLCKFR